MWLLLALTVVMVLLLLLLPGWLDEAQAHSKSCDMHAIEIVSQREATCSCAVGAVGWTYVTRSDADDLIVLAALLWECCIGSGSHDPLPEASCAR